jgi:acyl-[acyl-carrier-protein]-phospholipid O-acyltransferase/long-chain-fatty-acid--[acyl-carrier-protein] ligase
VVSVDGNGFMTIQGRVKRFAKIAGEMVSLNAIEEEIFSLWPAAKHAIICLPDARKGEQVVLVTTHPGADVKTIITHFLKHNLPEISIPKALHAMEELPVLGSGKVNYIAVKEMLLAERVETVDF